MSYTQALMIAYDRQRFGIAAYNLARCAGETRSAREIFRAACFREACRHINSEQIYGWLA